MKTQVIPVEAHDDVVSLRDKLAWVKARRVLLVLPRRGAAIDTRLAWLLLRRKAETMGAVLALVTHSTRVRRLAQEAGIPVFTSVLEAQQTEWQVMPARRLERRSSRADLESLRAVGRRVEARWRTRPVARLTFFSLAVLALFALLLFLLPAAEIQLSPLRIQQSLPVEVMAFSDAEQVRLHNGLPLAQVTVAVEGSKVWPASGRIPVPVTYARGTIRFRNLTDSVVGIPAGTVVQTADAPPVRFVTLNDAVVTAGVDKQVDVPARAELPGEGGNVPADALVVIDGPLGASLAATNPQAMHGGGYQSMRAPSEEDRRHARAALLAELRQQALALFKAQVAPTDLLLTDTLTLTEILHEVYFPAAAQPGDNLLLALEVRFSIHYLPGAALRQRAKAILDAAAPAGFLPADEDIRMTLVEKPVLDNEGVLRCRLLLQRDLKPRLDTSGLARSVRGRRPAVAFSMLTAQLPLQEAPQIRLRPSWWPWLPFTEFRIGIKW